MEQMIERLKASKVEYDEQEEGAGAARGRAWAIHEADYTELKDLAELEDAIDNENYYEGALGVLIEKHLYPEDYQDVNFWKEHGGVENGQPSDHHASGFALAAIEAFRKVEDEI